MFFGNLKKTYNTYSRTQLWDIRWRIFNANMPVVFRVRRILDLSGAVAARILGGADDIRSIA